MNEENIKYYCLDKNDDGTYRLSIETNGFDINYPRVEVRFISNGLISFPASFIILDENNNQINNYGLVTQDVNNKSENVTSN